MKALQLFLFSILLTITACSATSDNIDSNVKDIETIHLYRGIQEAEDNDFIFARKWQNENISLDLKLNGSFEGILNKKSNIFGTWHLTNDKKMLVLDSAQQEGKGNGFKIQYTILEATTSKLKILTQDKKTIVLISE